MRKDLERVTGQEATRQGPSRDDGIKILVVQGFSARILFYVLHPVTANIRISSRNLLVRVVLHRPRTEYGLHID
jgi:hypothetical protein